MICKQITYIHIYCVLTLSKIAIPSLDCEGYPTYPILYPEHNKLSLRGTTKEILYLIRKFNSDNITINFITRTYGKSLDPINKLHNDLFH